MSDLRIRIPRGEPNNNGNLYVSPSPNNRLNEMSVTPSPSENASPTGNSLVSPLSLGHSNKSNSFALEPKRNNMVEMPAVKKPFSLRNSLFGPRQSAKVLPFNPKGGRTRRRKNKTRSKSRKNRK